MFNKGTIFYIDFVFITEFVCYDDACHLKKYAQNRMCRNITGTNQKMADTEMMIDRFHFKNHVDPWCKQPCNPYKSDDIKVSAITLVISFMSMNKPKQATSFQVVNM